MKQVTGNNHSSVPQRVSIQQKLDGHSFSTVSLPEAIPGEGIECELSTVKTLLVPKEEFDPEAAAALLVAAGITPSEDECVVWSCGESDTVAVMAFDRETVELLRTRYANAVQFSTPLLQSVHCSVPTVLLDRRGDLLYIKVYDTDLQYAEVTTATAADDLLYLTETLNRLFPLDEFEFRLSGEFDSSERKLLRRYAKRIRS